MQSLVLIPFVVGLYLKCRLSGIISAGKNVLIPFVVGLYLKYHPVPHRMGGTRLNPLCCGSLFEMSRVTWSSTNGHPS